MRWQWLCEGKKNLTPQGLNATLRLTHFQERNDFLSDEILHEHLETEREWMAMELEALENDGVALGWRSAFRFRQRLGLNSAAHKLVADPPEPRPHEGGFATSWRNYVRLVLKRGHFFFFKKHPKVLFYASRPRSSQDEKRRERRRRWGASLWWPSSRGSTERVWCDQWTGSNTTP